MTTDIPHYPTGLIAFDGLTLQECPGLPAGRVTHVYGDAGTGKTTIALVAAAELARAEWTTSYFDLYNSLTPDRLEAVGVPYQNKRMFALFHLEQNKDMLRAAREMAGGSNLLVIDGAGVTPHMPMDDRIRIFRDWAEAFPLVTDKAKDTNCAVLVITNELGDCGSTLKLKADRRIHLERNPDGTINFTVEKDKVGRSPRGGRFQIPRFP